MTTYISMSGGDLFRLRGQTVWHRCVDAYGRLVKAACSKVYRLDNVDERAEVVAEGGSLCRTCGARADRRRQRRPR